MRARILCALLLSLAAASGAGCGGAQPVTAETPVEDPLTTVDPQELFDRGVYLAEHEDYIRAEQYLVAAMQRGFDEDRVMPTLLAACVRSSRLSAALSYAEPYLERHPDAWSLRLLVATIHMGLGEPGRAHAQLVRVVEDHPDEPTVFYMLGVLERDELEDLASARESFRRYLDLAPEGEHAAEARAALARAATAAASEDATVRPVRMPSHDPAQPAAQPATPAEETTP